MLSKFVLQVLSQTRVYAVTGKKRRIFRIFAGLDLILFSLLISEVVALSCKRRIKLMLALSDAFFQGFTSSSYSLYNPRHSSVYSSLFKATRPVAVVMPYGWIFSPLLWLQFLFAECITLSILLRGGSCLSFPTTMPKLAQALIRDNAIDFTL